MDQRNEHSPDQIDHNPAPLDWARLISAYLDDQISESEFSRLTQWLNDDENHKRDFVRAAMVHNGLRIILQNADLRALHVAQDSESDLYFHADSEGFRCVLEEVEEAGRRKEGSEQPKTGLRAKGQPTRRMLFLAIATSLLLSFSFIGVRSLVDRQADQEPGSAGQGAVIAVCRVADALEWSDAHRRLKPGDTVRTGRFALESGELRVETFEGALLTLNGPCDVLFESADKVVCHRGRLFVDVLRDDANLVIATPAGEVLHYGTVFSVNVVDSGATELSVFDGSVGLCSVPEANIPELSRLVFSGDAIRVEASGKVIKIEGGSQPLPSQLVFNSHDSNEPFHSQPVVIGPAGFDVTYVKSKGKSITCLREAELLLKGKIASSKKSRTSDMPWIDYQDSTRKPIYLNLFDKDDLFPGQDPEEPDEYDNSFAIRATGKLIVPDTWLYSFAVVVDDGARLRIDGQDVVVDDDGTHDPLLSIGTLSLQAGVHAIELTAYDAHGLSRLELGVAPGRVRDMDEFRLLTK